MDKSLRTNDYVPRGALTTALVTTLTLLTRSKTKIKTPTLPKTGEEWGTQNAWKLDAKPKSKPPAKPDD
jgi:hypothetical protein